MKLDITRLPVGEMMVGFLIAALLATFILAFTLVDSGTSATEGGATAAPSTPISGSADIALGDNFFDPKEITVSAGDSVTFNLSNAGVAIHNMHIAQADGSFGDAAICEPGGADACSDPSAVPGGQTAVLVWEVPDAPGTQIPFRCDFHPVDMTGTITIQ